MRAIFNQSYMVDKIGREDAENMFKTTIQPIIKVRYDGKMGNGKWKWVYSCALS
jgi:hypothetical protein